MAKEDENGQEKTEEATAKKLEEARKKGQVAKSKDLPAAFTMVGLLFFASILGKDFFFSLGKVFKLSFSHLFTVDLTIVSLLNTSTTSLKLLLPYLAIIFAILLLAGVLANVAVTGFVINNEALKFDITKINPISKFKQMFLSFNSVVELIKGSLKMSLFVLIAMSVIFSHFNDIEASGKLTSTGIIFLLGRIFLEILKKAVLVYVILGIADWVYQKRKFNEDMKMTKQEIKDEYKNTEGNPEVKQQLKRKRREMISNATQQEVQGADVVITNPTHFAVAIKYDKNTMFAPKVVAKGTDFMALQIKKIAKEANVTVYEAPPLARFIYKTVKVGQEIPEEAYKAVAEILIRIYKKK